MASVSELQVETALKDYVEPYLNTDLVSAKAVAGITIDGGRATIDLVLGFPLEGYRRTLADAVAEVVTKNTPAEGVTVNIEQRIESHAVQQGVSPINGVKNIIAVASGKGGVGKSTTAVNLALALAGEGATVGILDADIYGPSLPRMMGLSDEKPDSKDNKTLEPMVSYGVQSMSIGYLIEPDTPMIWRGPMVTQALGQLLNDTNWKDLDYLVIDLPPGTGDIQLTLAQQVPVSGALIVTTPQDIALLDAHKAHKMFEKVSVPSLGIVENMSIHICSNCGHEEHIFGEGGGQAMADQYGLELLGSLPLDIHIREQADGGKPTVAADPEGRVTEIYREIARATAARLSLQAREHSHKFPNIVVENN
ncbi:MAG: iron-sulfur cluster carrier protein ApbC [Pseudomonadota bacterium]